MNWKELLNQGTFILKNHNIFDSEYDALQLILTFFDDSYSDYCLKFSETVSKDDADLYFKLIAKRCENFPLQYILGKWDFYNSTFLVGEGVLIPRPETEELVEFCVDYICKNGSVVVYDLCSGSGCIGLSIAKECPDVNCYLFELYPDAFEFSVKNKVNLKLNNADVINFDVLKVPDFSFPKADLIVSNPPYIKSSDISLLQKEVQMEPHTALDGGCDGLDFYRAFYNNWTELLNTDGVFAFECGEEQSNLICKIFEDRFSSSVIKDSFGADRFVILKKIR